VRTSNFFVNVLASTGIVGSLLFATFVAMTYRRHATQRDSCGEAIIKAIKLALLPMFTGAFFAGTTPDIGVIPCIMFGIVAALAAKPPLRLIYSAPAGQRRGLRGVAVCLFSITVIAIQMRG
jgi:hypothetical protein